MKIYPCLVLSFLPVSILSCMTLKDIPLGSSEQEVVHHLGLPREKQQVGSLTNYDYGDQVAVFRDQKLSHTVDKRRGTEGYKIEIEGLTGNPPQQKTASIISAKKDTTIEDIEFKEYSKMLVKILSSKGYTFVTLEQKPEMIIAVNYGISEPRHRSKTYSEPVYDYVMPKRPPSQTQSYYGSSGQYLGKTETNSAPSFSMPEEVYMGERMQTREWTEYIRYFKVDAFSYEDVLSEKEPVQFWTFKASSVGQSSDIRKIMRAMMLVAKDFITQNTNSKKEVNIWSNDPSLEEFNSL